MKIIEKKVWPEYFEKILSGEKNFELRLADWKCSVGDTLILREWNPKTSKFTGRKIKRTVNYVLKTKNQKFWNKKEVSKYGFLVIGFK